MVDFCCGSFIHMRFHSLFLAWKRLNKRMLEAEIAVGGLQANLVSAEQQLRRSLRVCSWIGRTPGQRRRIA